MTSYVGLIVPTRWVKLIKKGLETRNLLDRNLKIKPHQDTEYEGMLPELCAVIPTTQLNTERTSLQLEHSSLLEVVVTEIFGSEQSFVSDLQIVGVTSITHESAHLKTSVKNPFHHAVLKALVQSRPPPSEREMKLLLEVLPVSYNTYFPMLLLPSHTFFHQSWKTFFDKFEEYDSLARDDFLNSIADQMHVSHIAINAPIPAFNNAISVEVSKSEMIENLLRSPINLQPLHGDFGPALSAFPKHIPTISDFEEAFWVHIRQNGITQVWAPRYTMFSSGNVTEKARILNMQSVDKSVQEGARTGLCCSAVDLFAGIGYFAFSYAKAGVTKVLCWDLNPWSLEGLRRGATANNWNTRFFQSFENMGTEDSKGSYLQSSATGAQAIFLVFPEDNKHAKQRITKMRAGLPPIRHVNCGMLPSVGEAWKTALEALDPHLGGWLHLHETVPRAEIDERAARFRQMVEEHLLHIRQDNVKSVWHVQIEHIEKVKSVGPRLWHIVVDLWVGPQY